MRDEYEVEVRRDEQGWQGEVVDLPGSATWHPKSLAGLRRSLAEAIVLADELLDEDIDEVLSRLVLRLAGDADGELVEVTRKRRIAAAAAVADAEALTERTVTRLRGRMSVRDIAALTGVSPARVSQIAAAQERLIGHSARKPGVESALKGRARVEGNVKR